MEVKEVSVVNPETKIMLMEALAEVEAVANQEVVAEVTLVRRNILQSDLDVTISFFNILKFTIFAYYYKRFLNIFFKYIEIPKLRLTEKILIKINLDLNLYTGCPTGRC